MQPTLAAPGRTLGDVARQAVGENGAVSNPYAPPGQRPVPEPDDASQGAEPAPGQQPPQDAPPAPPAPQRRTPPPGLPVPSAPRAATSPSAHAPASGPEAPGAPQTAPVGATLRDIDPEQLRRIGASVRHFGAFLLAAVLVGTFPLPWRVASLAFVVGALVVGVRALSLVRRAHVRGALVPLLAVGLLFTGILAIGTVGSLVFWSAETHRQECLSGALTISARSACEQQYQDDLSRWQQEVRRSAGLSAGS